MQVEHDPKRHRFFLRLPTGAAMLAYAPVGERRLELFSTYVPAQERGRGLAAMLVEAAVGYARAEGYRIVPTCWYVAQWIRAHPEHLDLIAA